MRPRPRARREQGESGHDPIGYQHHNSKDDHPQPDRPTDLPDIPLTSSPEIHGPDQAENRRVHDRRKLARESKPADRRARDEIRPSSPCARERGGLQEPHEEEEQRGRRRDQRHLHRHDRAVRQQIRAEREEARREGHRARPMAPTAPRHRQPERGEPDPESGKPDDRQQRRLIDDRPVDQAAQPDPVEDEEGGGGLELEERQRRAHPGDLGRLPLAPPVGGDPEIGDLVIRRRADHRRLGHQDQPGDPRAGDDGPRPAGRPLCRWDGQDLIHQGPRRGVRRARDRRAPPVSVGARPGPTPRRRASRGRRPTRRGRRGGTGR